MSRQLRIHVFTRTVPAERGYIGETKERVQQLQVMGPLGWVLVDEEIVPEAALIAEGATGDCGWCSKFAVFGSWGRDGKVRFSQAEGAA